MLKINYKDIDINTQMIEKRKKEINMVSEPQEWGGMFGTFILIFLLPVIIIVPQLLCAKNECTFKYHKISTDLNFYVNVKAFIAYLSLFLFVIIVSIIPIGRKLDGLQSRIERLQYRLNGNFILNFENLLYFKNKLLE